MNKLVRWQQKMANWKMITGLLIIFIIFQIAVLPNVAKQLNDYSNDAGVIDLQLSYSVDKIYEMTEAYGEEGRRLYMWFSSTGDVIYPIVYSLLFSSIVTLLYRRAFRAQSSLHRLPLLVYMTLLFDLLENAFIVTVMANFPDRLTTVAQVSNIFTMAKWSLAGASVLLIVSGLILIPFKRTVEKPTITH